VLSRCADHDVLRTIGVRSSVFPITILADTASPYSSATRALRIWFRVNTVEADGRLVVDREILKVTGCA
jgi:hypothetical protein